MNGLREAVEFPPERILYFVRRLNPRGWEKIGRDFDSLEAAREFARLEAQGQEGLRSRLYIQKDGGSGAHNYIQILQEFVGQGLGRPASEIKS